MGDFQNAYVEAIMYSDINCISFWINQFFMVRKICASNLASFD